MTSRKPSAWKFALVPTLVVLFLAIYPQINIWLIKGSSWHGSYVVSNYDEVAYSAYVNALTEGRPRKNDPFVGKDDLAQETLYSIQVVPAYSIAMPARIFGFSASTAFIILNFLIAIFSSLAVFFLFLEITHDDLLSAVGSLATLCLGTAVAFQGELQHMIQGNYLCDFFPFLRRYQPGFAFPLFFVFCVFVWRTLNASEFRRAFVYAAASGIAFVILVFSYFYLWTAALAWLGCFTAFWIIGRREERYKTLAKAGFIGLFVLAAVIPYFLLLAGRVQNLDDVQLLSYTRLPNLFALPELIGFVVAGAIFYFVRNGKINFRSPEVLFVFSIALTPLVLFNQQVVTGRSLQPVHYEIFIANYLVLADSILAAWIITRSFDSDRMRLFVRRSLVYLGIVAAIWGLSSCGIP